jgi:hypothetical protein
MAQIGGEGELDAQSLAYVMQQVSLPGGKVKYKSELDV